jgi:prepilin-type N-terminal cleavage/methylation domain-containing protein
MSATAICVRPARRSAGFTVIEILIALLIFATGMLALALCMPMATKRIMKAGSQTRASSLASETAEELLTRPYGDGSLTSGAHVDAANPHDGSYYIQWLVEDDAPQPGCKRITVRVSRRSVNTAPDAQIVVVTPQSGG